MHNRNQISIKKELLIILKNQPSHWVSGETISAQLQVTRSAIWKHIQKLREEGYKIQSSPKLGYILSETPEKPIPIEIQEGLQTVTFGKQKLIYFPEVDSTNRVAKDLALENAPEGTVVIAEKQTKGRGRLGREWFSPSEDGIYISLILRPNIPPQEAPKLTLMTAVAIADALISITALPVQIKWPNDILINNKKVAGILTEINSEMDMIGHIVVGLGLNVNTSSFPDEIKETATSLFQETGTRYPRTKLVREYLQHYERYYNIFKQSGFSPILKKWKELSNMIGKPIKVVMLNEQHAGIVQDIDLDGALLLKASNGKVQRVICGDITILKGALK